MAADLALLTEVPLLHTLDQGVLTRLIPWLEARSYLAGQVIFREGEAGEGLYIVESGEVVLSRLHDPEAGTRRVVASILRGGSFCEMTVLEPDPRTVMARAQGDTALWALPRAAFATLRIEDPGLANAIYDRLLAGVRERLKASSTGLVNLYETRPRIEKLRLIPLFSKLDDRELGQVAAALEWCELPDGAVVFTEGEVGDTMYIVEEGIVEVSKRIDVQTGSEKVIAVVGRGAFFGEMSLLDDFPRSATARARGPLRLLVMNRPVWRDLLRDSATLASKLLFGILQTTINRLRRSSRDLVTLYDTGKLVGSVTDATELSCAIAQRICEALEADSGAVVLTSPYSGAVQVKGQTGLGPDFGAGPYPCGTVMQALLLTQAKDLTSQLGQPGYDLEGIEATALMAAPLVTPAGTIGAFLVARNRPSASFTGDDLNLLSSVATQVAAAVENARMREEEAARVEHGRVYVGF